MAAIENEAPSEETGEPIPDDVKEFLEKRNAIAEALKDDEKFRQCIAELYIFMSNIDTAVRSIGQMGGPKAMLKMIMGKGGE